MSCTVQSQACACLLPTLVKITSQAPSCLLLYRSEALSGIGESTNKTTDGQKLETRGNQRAATLPIIQTERNLLFFLSNRMLLSLCVIQGAESEFQLHVHCQSLVKKHVYSSGPKNSLPCAGTVQGPSCPVQVRALFTFPLSLLNPKLLHRGVLSESAAVSSQTELQLGSRVVSPKYKSHALCLTAVQVTVMKATCLSLVISMQKQGKDRDQSWAFDPYSFSYNLK